MSLKYFSQYLLLEGYITSEQLGAAIAKAGVTKDLIGDLAVEAGYMSQEQADDLNKKQVQRDMRIGDLAIEEGYLTEEQLESILRRQGAEHQRLGDALVDLDFITGDLRDHLLRDFQRTRGQSAVDVDALVKPFECIESSKAVRQLLTTFPKMTMRLSQVHVRPCEGAVTSADTWMEYSAAIELSADNEKVRFAITADRPFSDKLLHGMVKIMSGDDDIAFGTDKSDYEDLLGGFLDIITGNIVGALDSAGDRYEPGTPTFGVPDGDGVAFPMASTLGDVALVFYCS